MKKSIHHIANITMPILISEMPEGAKVEVVDLNQPTNTDHLLEVIDALAYQLACYKYPNHKVHNFDDKEEILTDVGLDDCFKRELVKER